MPKRKKKQKGIPTLGFRRKGGTHGSLSKAGRAIDRHPPIFEREIKKFPKKGKERGQLVSRKYHGKLLKNRKTPRTNNRRRYNQMLNKLQKGIDI